MAIKALHGFIVALSSATVVGVGKSSTVVGATSLDGSVSGVVSKSKYRRTDINKPDQTISTDPGPVIEDKNEEENITHELPQEGDGLDATLPADPNSLPGDGVAGSADSKPAGDGNEQTLKAQ